MLFVIILSLLRIAAAGPLTSNTNDHVRPMVVHDSRAVHPAAFTHVKSADPEHVLNLGIHLRSVDRDGLEQRVIAASSPGHPNYGKHMSKDEVASYMKPAPETHAAVSQWLESHGLNHTTTTYAGDWLMFSAPVSKANNMLQAQFNVYNHKETGEDIVRTLAYSLPEDIEPHVRMVQPTTSFYVFKHDGPVVEEVKAPTFKPSARSQLALRQDPCSPVISPACLQSLYGIPTWKASNSANSIGIAAFGNQYVQSTDLAVFLQKYRPDMEPTGYVFESILGGQDVQDTTQAKGNGEANLDMQQAIGLATGVPVTFMSVGSNGTNWSSGSGNVMWDMANVLLAQDTVPTVVSTSYSYADESHIGADTVSSWCDSYMQLGARGVTVLFATGDQGVGGSSDGSCTAFTPSWPSGCPYVTSVGATGGHFPEIAANFSSGGFSNYFPTPAWQSGSVSSYLGQLAGANSGMFNSSGRAFPDVSAQGMNVAWVNGGVDGTIGGTSAATPIFAAIVALLNEELLSAGKSTLGYLNPWLYANAGAFTDITSGSNPGCGTSGFPALGGWDPVTGLGTPVYSSLRSAAGLQ